MIFAVVCATVLRFDCNDVPVHWRKQCQHLVLSCKSNAPDIHAALQNLHQSMKVGFFNVKLDMRAFHVSAFVNAWPAAELTKLLNELLFDPLLVAGLKIGAGARVGQQTLHEVVHQ